MKTSLARFNKTIARFTKDESGATTLEYGLIAAGIAVAIITALNALIRV